MPTPNPKTNDADKAMRIQLAIHRAAFQGAVSQARWRRSRSRLEKVANRAIFRRPNPIPFTPIND